MNILKKLGLAFASLAFVMALSVVSANAQPGKAGWNGNNGKHRGWTQGQHRGWNKGRKTGWQDRNSWWSRQTDRRYRTGRYDDYEYRRLERQRERLYNADEDNPEPTGILLLNTQLKPSNEKPLSCNCLITPKM